MRKAVIVGAGSVGSCAAQMLALDGLFQSIILVDKRHIRSAAESQDLMTALARMRPSVEVRDGSFADACDADIVILCASAPARLGQSRNDMFVKNAQIAQDVVREVEESGFQGLYLIVSNPVDLMTYYLVDALRISPRRVIGSGTVLDTMRLEDHLRASFGQNSKVEALAVGEHGEGLLVDWDAVSVDGAQVPCDAREGLRRATIDTAYNIMKGKGSTSYGIAFAITRIAGAWVHRNGAILPLSIAVQGEYGIDDIAISLPVAFDKDGAPHVVANLLNAGVVDDLKAIAANLRETYASAVASSAR